MSTCPTWSLAPPPTSFHADQFLNGVLILAVAGRMATAGATVLKPSLHLGCQVKLGVGGDCKEGRLNIGEFEDRVLKERFVVHAVVVPDDLLELTRFFGEMAGGFSERLRINYREHFLIAVAR